MTGIPHSFRIGKWKFQDSDRQIKISNIVGVLYLSISDLSKYSNVGFGMCLGSGDCLCQEPCFSLNSVPRSLGKGSGKENESTKRKGWNCVHWLSTAPMALTLQYYPAYDFFSPFYALLTVQFGSEIQ